jgi:hypothetical protein
MKKEFFMTLAAVGMVAGLSANQPSAAAPAQSSQQEKNVSNLSADELAFAAKLSDQNRKVFSTQFSAEQRKAAMAASCAASGACAAGQKVAMAPNDAVQKVSKDSNAVVVEKQEVTPSSKPAAQVK